MSNRQVPSSSLSRRQRRRDRQAKNSRAKNSRSRRDLLLESLEQRQLLAVGPRLLDIETNFGGSVTENNGVLNQAPQQLTLEFAANDVLDPTTIQQGVSVFNSGGDGVFGNGNDQTVDSAFLGLGAVNNEILVRFAENLPDDDYRVLVRGSGTPLTDIVGDPFNEGVDFVQEFSIEKGARVVSVVPQPVTRDPGTNSLSQELDQIVVFFDDDMDPATAEDVSFYELEDKATGVAQLPTSAVYDAAEKKVTLTFSSDLVDSSFYLQVGADNEASGLRTSAENVGTITSQSPYSAQAFIGDDVNDGVDEVDLYRVNLLDDGNLTVAIDPADTLLASVRIFDNIGTPVVSASSGSAGDLVQLFRSLTAGVYYIGVSSAGNDAYDANTPSSGSGGSSSGQYGLNLTFDQNLSVNDDNSAYATATDIGVLGNSEFRHTDGIFSGRYELRLPGGNDDPGHRDIPFETHLNGAVVNRIETHRYNFQDFYGFLPNGDVAQNAITENQKDRTREIFEIYGNLMGVQFIETNNEGLTVVTGDLRAISPTIPVGPGGVAGLSEGSMFGRVIMDAGEGWGDSLRGGGWFEVAMHEIGHSLGLGHTYDQPALTVMGDRDQSQFNDNGEPIYPGPVDEIHARHLRAPVSNDLDLYRFEITESGVLTADAVAGRRDAFISLLDTELSLFRETDQGGRTVRELIASNDDYFGDDARLQLHLEAGTYFIGVHSSGLQDIDPSLSDSGFGGVSEGLYDLELDFEADANDFLRDAEGTPLDGDSDGAPGGVHDFWFQSGSTVFVDKLNDVSVGTDGDGSLADPFDNIQAAVDFASSRIVVPSAGGSVINDGDTFTVADEFGDIRTFNFGGGGIPVSPADSAEDVAQAIADALNDPGNNWTVNAVVNGSTVELSNVIQRDVAGTPALVRSSNLIRVVGNGGGDGDITTAGDNDAYLIGFDNDGAVLEDGLSLIVPQGVTVMVDAGALFKMQRSVVEVGSSGVNIDSSGAAFQLLGIPGNEILFRSFRDDTVGGNDDGPGVPPESGDWGGIVFRGDSDFEDDGIFLNNLTLADLQDGGGKVNLSSSEETFTPVHLDGSRPTIANLSIRGSASAAISADPSSFKESDGRVGPEINNNLVVENSINGLFVRINTEIGQELERLEVSARFDDTDIVHVFTQSLIVAGNPGGEDETSGQRVGRAGASLTIDPGTIIKMEGARIELEVGARLLAEGNEGSEVIFTALKDDTYGVGGTADTTNDGQGSGPAAGAWGGLYFGYASSASIDHAVIRYGGGETAIEGGSARFNPIEVHGADVRVTNSDISDNLSGRDGSTRNGRATNGDAVIFVRGAQPIIAGNRIFDNASSSAISIDVNSLQGAKQVDAGRQTGLSESFTDYVDNFGPLIRENLLENNSLDGMDVRGGVLKTEGVWDDVGITHVVRDDIAIPNFHSLGGLRLQSSNAGSLVIKLDGNTAGFTASGNPLDISDRIGGSLYVIGVPNRPVVFTSIDDDTVGAGFDLSGDLIMDVNNNGDSEGSPGDWRSIQLNRWSNDRNVSLHLENESARIGLDDQNSIPGKAEFLGTLADVDKNGDDDRRVGFSVIGNIAIDEADDLDVYSFQATPGTEVWLDVDRTDSSLDAVVELIDANGIVIARSLDKDSLSGAAMSMTKDPSLGPDLYTANTRDPGMRVVLPQTGGNLATYYVRVRSERPTEQNPNSQEERSRGQYQLQIRLRQIDEVPGSSIRTADIRYATNGIEVLGLPAHSDLTGEATESAAGNNSFGSAQPLGNLLNSERSTISVGGNLVAQNNGNPDIDWYSFELDLGSIQSIADVNDGGKTWSTVFDIDYADGIARADTILAVFNEQGHPILISRDSNVADDRSAPGQGADLDDLSRGSVGTLDPFLGSVQLPTGGFDPGNLNAGETYFVAVSSNQDLPTALQGTFQSATGSSLVRLEPVNSIRRIAEDHIGFHGHSTGHEDFTFPVDVTPEQTLFDISNSTALETNVLPFSLRDVVLYTATPGNNGLRMVNPATGTDLGGFANLPGNTPVTDIVMRADGRLYIYESLFGNAGNNTAGRLVEIDPTTGNRTVVGNDSIPNFDPNTNPPNIQQLTSSAVQGFAWQRTNDNNNPWNLWYAVQGAREPGGVNSNSSTLYRANPGNGSAAVATNQPWGRRGEIFENTEGDLGVTTGMAFSNGSLFGVNDQGDFYRISLNDGSASSVVNLGLGGLTGLTEGPKNLEDGRFNDILFATTDAGQIVAVDTDGMRLNEFLDPFTGVPTSTATLPVNAVGLAFSPLDFNLWHPTMLRHGDDGHGINESFDNSRFPSQYDLSLNGRDSDQEEGGASFYFGLEEWVQNPAANNNERYFTYGPNSQYGILEQQTHQDLNTNTRHGNNYNLPGGARGSLATNSFSLDKYSRFDKPVIYFNYFLETENANSSGNGMRDSFRVQITRDGGLTWEMLATNNSIQNGSSELPFFLSTSSTESFDSRQQVQELFDNTGGWRQARVDLSNYAGELELQVRFDFTTSGTMERTDFLDTFSPGDDYGNRTNRTQATNNANEGVYIDDIIIGFAERGEMVTETNPTSRTGHFEVPRDAFAPSQGLEGAYQLEIRRGSEYQSLNTDSVEYTTVDRQFDTNDRLVLADGIFEFGDQNTRRETGQIQVEQNSIRDASGYGIFVDAGARDSQGNLPAPASVLNLPTLNTQRLVAGITIENNLISSLGQGGIFFSGDPNTGNTPDAAVPYGRILNNTIYGTEDQGGIGINVTQNASPSLLNNVIANTARAISIDGSSSSTVVDATLIQNNTNPGNFSDTQLIALGAGDPLFVDPAAGNFYLASGSRAIDSSRNSLDDRTGIVAVKSAVGISPSPILTPDRDLFSQFRIDDPTQDPPPGLGSEIFKDRGAVERADFVGPTVRLINPEDNDATGIDVDETLTFVQLSAGQLTTFEILFADDPGIGPDPSTINDMSISIVENGFQLQPDVDFLTRYNPNSGLLTLSPISGEWSGNSVFVITLDNDQITDLAGNQLQPNRPDGSTTFTILMPDVELDFGDAPDTYGTLGTAGGPRHAINDLLTPRLGELVDTELNGQPGDLDDLVGEDDEDGVPIGTFSGATDFEGLVLGVDGGTTSDPGDVVGFLNRDDAAGTVLPVTVFGSGVIDAWIDFNRDGDFNENNERVLSGAPVVDGLNNLRVFTPAGADLGTTWARFRISSEGTDSPGGIANNGEVEDYKIGIFDVTGVDANDDAYSVSEDAVLVVDGSASLPGLTDNETLPTEEYVEPRIVVDGAPVAGAIIPTFRTANGQVQIDDPVRGLFTYTPDEDFEGLDTFRYAVSTQRNEGTEFLATADFATVEITVNPFNAPPEFEIPQEVAVLEDEPATWTIDPFFTNVVGGSSDFGQDELAQVVTFTINEVSVQPANLMSQDPDVSSGSAITFFPTMDVAGFAVYEVTGTDDGVPVESLTKTFTVFVRPVNDPPRFDPAVAGESGQNGADDQYSVANVVDPGTGIVVDATITYTLREDNSQPVGSPALPYFIPLERDATGGGYNRVGLMDVFNVGPDNEADPTIEGGGQTLSFNSVPLRTTLGGELVRGFNDLGQEGIFYTPPTDYNNVIGGPDSFAYSVIDDGESYINGVLVSDPRVSVNTVLLDLNPVNDKPQFIVNLPPADPQDPTGPRAPVEAVEDSTTTRLTNFAFAIEAGPPNTAFDEVDVINGEKVTFEMTPLSYQPSEAGDYFTVVPSISEAGTLEFQPAPDVFGNFEYVVVAQDDGSNDPNRGDEFQSVPITVTINILPINDPPVVRDDVDPIVVEIQEDNSVDIFSRGDVNNPGMLDVFAVGPDNEAGPLTPGGNQTLALREPTPLQTVFGGTISQIIENGELVGLRYTPRANFVGMDSFIYTVVDDGVSVGFGTGGTPLDDPRIASNTVSIDVLPVNDAPQFSGPANVTVDEDAGAVSFENWATNVFAGPPTALDELNSQSMFFVLNQVSGPSNLFSSAPQAVIDGESNTASLNFETAPDANGTAVFEVQLFDVPTDGTDQEASTTRTFTLRVNPVNDAPTFDSPADPIAVDEDSGPYSQAWATNISPGPIDEQDQTVRFDVDVPLEFAGLFQQLPTVDEDGVLRFQSANHANGTAEVVVTAVDSPGESSVPVTLTISIQPVNDPPIAVADSTATDEDTALQIPSSFLLQNDIDPDIDNPDDFLTVVMPEEGFSLSGARVLFNPTTGVVTYDPSTSSSLQSLPAYRPAGPGQEEEGRALDSFTYRVVDSTGTSSNVVTVGITVDGVNDAPIVQPDNPTLNPDGPTVIDVLANDTDIDGDIVPTSIEITLQPAFGSLSIGPDGVITFTAFQSFALEDVFRYRVADNDGKFSAETQVTIEANAAPIARDDQQGTFLDEPIVINVAANDEDPDPEPGAPNGGLDLTSIQIVSVPGRGDAVPLGDGTVRYIPDAGFLGIDSFMYTIMDSSGRVSSPGTVQVQVVGSRLQNPNLNTDVNADGSVSPLDALLVINRLSLSETGDIPVEDTDMGPPYYDVDGNKRISPIDALEVINELQRRQANAAEGEQASPMAFLSTPSVSTDGGESLGGEAGLSGDASSPLASFDTAEQDVELGFVDSLVGNDDDDDDDDRMDALDVAFGDLL